MADLPPGLVWLASYPKSGNTWMRLLFANLMAGEEAAIDINDFGPRLGLATARDRFEAQAAVDSSLLTLAEIERARPGVHEGMAAALTKPVVLKTHDAFVRTPEGAPVLGRAARAALYVVRDPRDVAVSYAHHLNASQAEAARSMNDPDEAFVAMGPQIDYRQLGWSRHVESWLDQRDLPVLVIRYEDLHADAAAAFARALGFLGARFSEEEVASAVRRSSFAALQRQEAESGFRERTSRAAPFFRRGEAGGWRDELAPGLAAEIERANAAVMARMGYEAALVS